MKRPAVLMLALLFVPSLLMATHPVFAPPQGEKMLIPVAVEKAPGAFGAVWSSDFWFRNESDLPVDVIQNLCYLQADPRGCSIPGKSNVHRSSLLIGSPTNVPARLLFVPSERAGDILFSLRVRDLTRGMFSGGTELPIVRERDFRAKPVELINVPMESNFRATLRIYDVDVHDTAEFRVTMIPFSDGPVPAIVDQRTVRIVRAHFDDSSFVPGYAQIDDLKPLGAAVSILIEPLTPGLRFWTFVSVTNNTTQEITTILPQ